MAFNISYIYEIVNKASRPLRNIAKSQKKVGDAAVKSARKVKKASKSQEKSILSLSEIASRATGIMAAAFAVGLPIKQAIDFESAMADVGKVVDFPLPDGLKKMGKTIQQLSKELPITQTGLADIVAAGGQLGVPAEKLDEFARLAGKMSIAFDILPQDAGEAMAKLSNIFGIPIEEMEKVGDAINFVSNNAAASAGEIVIAMKSGAGAGGRAMGLTEVQAIALSTQFIAQGLSASEAGTRVQILARNLLNTKKTTKLLGAGFTDLVKKSPQKAIEKLLDAVAAGKIPQVALNELLGLTVNDFTLLAKNGDSYRRILGLVSDETKFAGSMNKEFAVRSATTGNQLILLGNAARNIGINIGSALLPAVRSVTEVLSKAADEVANFFERFPFAAEALGNLAAAFVGVKVAILAAKIAQFGFNAVLLANPILLVVAAGVALVAIALAMADEFPIIGDIFRDLSNVFSGFGDSFAPLGDLFGQVFGDGAGAVEIFGRVVRTWLTPLVAMVELIKRLASADFSSLSSIADAFSGAGQAALSFFSNENGVSPNMSPETQEVSGNLGIDINLSGNTGAVESASARPKGNGNLGMNMAFAR